MSQGHPGYTQPNKKIKKERSRHSDRLLSTAAHLPPPNTTPKKHKRSPKVMPPRREHCTSVVVAGSKILGFNPGESPRSQNNSLNKVIARHDQWRSDLRFSPWKSRLGTWGDPKNENRQCCRPHLSLLLLRVIWHQADSIASKAPTV